MSKKPVEDDDETPLPRRGPLPSRGTPEAPDPEVDRSRARRPHAEADRPDAPAPDEERIPLLPLLIGPPLLPDGPPPDPPRRPGEVGLVRFEKGDGSDNGSATYHVSPALRDRVLLWRHQLHEQNHQTEDGTWVYRLTPTSGVGSAENDPNLEPLIVQPSQERGPRA